MELADILRTMAEPEKLVEPNQIALLVQHISGFITDFTLEQDELNVAYGFAWEGMKYRKDEKPLSDKVVDIRMMRTDIYTKLQQVKRTLGELRRFRSDLNRRLDIIMGIKRR